jgi:hypothetical protein
MKEFSQVRQIPGEPRRRWFYSDDFDLVIWFNDDGSPTGFELCYDKRTLQRAVRWDSQHGLQTRVVDEGEERPGKHKATPLLLTDVDLLDLPRVRSAFAAESPSLPRAVADCVQQALAGEG